MVGDLVVADVQVGDGGVPNQPGHEHPHQVVVDQVTLHTQVFVPVIIYRACLSHGAWSIVVNP